MFYGYPGLRDCAISYPGSSAGSTITFGIVEDTSSNPTSNIFFEETRASYYKLFSLVPLDLDIDSSCLFLVGTMLSPQFQFLLRLVGI